MGKFFSNVKSLDALKKAYKELARKLHPDFGGSLEKMQALNNEYEEMVKYFATHGNKTEREKASAEVPKKFCGIISKLMTMPDVRIEIVGGWIWLDNAGKHLVKIKQLGFRYSTKQKRYYLPDDVGISTPKRASRYSMSQIRDIYGSQFIDGDSANLLN